MDTIPRSQNHLADLLGISRGTVSKAARQGMPTHSLNAAIAWRRNLCPGRSKQPPTQPQQRPPSGAVPHAQNLMDTASLMLEAGLSVDSLVPSLQAAMRAVPDHERDDVGLDPDVMDYLLAEILAVGVGTVEDDGRPTTDVQYQEMGKFLYQAACGEWVLNP